MTRPAATGGADRPQTRISYSTQQAWCKNSGGSIVASGVSTYVPTGVSVCASGSSCTGTAAETTITIGYQAGSSSAASNLLPATTTVAAGDSSVSATTTTGYDAVGNVTSVDGPLSGSDDTVTYRYDADREQVGVISPDPDGAGALKRRAAETTYNLDGQPTVTEIGTVNGTSDSDWSAFASLQQSTSTYDANGYKTKDVLTASSTTYQVTQYSYDSMGRPECTALRMNSATWGSCRLPRARLARRVASATTASPGRPMTRQARSPRSRPAMA